MDLSLRLVSAGLLVGSVACGFEGGGFEGPDATPDLFGCVDAPDCIQDHGHLGEALTDEALRCGEELVASGEPGAIVVQSRPGPHPTEIEDLLVFVGDGTVYRQQRTRCAREDSCEDTAWVFEDLEVCTLVEQGVFEGCTPVEAFACGDLEG